MQEHRRGRCSGSEPGVNPEPSATRPWAAAAQAWLPMALAPRRTPQHVRLACRTHEVGMRPPPETAPLPSRVADSAGPCGRS